MRPPHLILLLAAAAAAASPSPAAPALQPERVVTGIAVDPQGQPVAGAAVWLEAATDTDEEYQAYLQAGPAATTGADGRFSVTLPERSGGLEICVPGSLLGSVKTWPPPAGPVTVQIRPGASISGQVVDADGAPLAGLPVSTALAGSEQPEFNIVSSPCYHPGQLVEGATDRDGRFRLAPLEPGWYKVKAGEDLVESASLRLAPGQALSGMRLVVEHAVRLSGRVTARDGAPVPGATVYCGSRSTATDATGHYQLAGLASGLHPMGAYDSRHDLDTRDVELAPGDNRVDLVLGEAQVIRGRVLRPDGKPAAGAAIDASAAKTATAADGTFQLTIPRNRCSCSVLRVQAAGFGTTQVALQGDLDALEIRLARPGSITGRVLGRQAPAGTKVFAHHESLHMVTHTDATGRFRFPELAPGNWGIRVELHNREKTAETLVVSGEEKSVDLTFTPLHRVSGWVVDAAGKPASCESVYLFQNALCRSDGTFTSEAEDGTYTPIVTVDGTLRSFEPLTVTVAGAPVDRIEIRLHDQVIVTGHIAGLQPGDIAEAIDANRLEDSDSEDSYSGGTADQDGGYRVELWPGDWTIRAVFGDRKAEKRLHVPAGVQKMKLDLTFPPGR